MTEPGLDRRRRDIAADGGGIGRADQQQRWHLQILEFVVHRLGEEGGTVGFYSTPVVEWPLEATSPSKHGGDIEQRILIHPLQYRQAAEG